MGHYNSYLSSNVRAFLSTYVMNISNVIHTCIIPALSKRKAGGIIYLLENIGLLSVIAVVSQFKYLR